MYIIIIGGAIIMPIIRPSSDLRNNYNEISTLCHKTRNWTIIKRKKAKIWINIKYNFQKMQEKI